MTSEISLQRIRERMSSNGYACFDREAFDKNLNRPCYIPEGAEELEDVFTRRDLKREVQGFLKDNPEYVKANIWAGESIEEFVEGIVVELYEELEWQYPCAVLENWNS